MICSESWFMILLYDDTVNFRKMFFSNLWDDISSMYPYIKCMHVYMYIFLIV